MLCQYCGRREGVRKMIIRGNVRETVCICHECEAASLRARFTAPAAPAAPATPPPRETPHIRCPQCGWSSEEFAATKLLGCPHCYGAMASVLADVVRRCQPSGVHVGKSPDGGRRASEYERLRGELERAVREERYEDAAALKRMLDGLKGGRPC